MRQCKGQTDDRFKSFITDTIDRGIEAKSIEWKLDAIGHEEFATVRPTI